MAKVNRANTIYVLSEEDVEAVAKKLGINIAKLSQSKWDTLVRHAQKYVEAMMDAGVYTWVDAIKDGLIHGADGIGVKLKRRSFTM